MLLMCAAVAARDSSKRCYAMRVRKKVDVRFIRGTTHVKLTRFTSFIMYAACGPETQKWQLTDSFARRKMRRTSVKHHDCRLPDCPTSIRPRQTRPRRCNATYITTLPIWHRRHRQAAGVLSSSRSSEQLYGVCCIRGTTHVNLTRFTFAHHVTKKTEQLTKSKGCLATYP